MDDDLSTSFRRMEINYRERGSRKREETVASSRGWNGGERSALKLTKSSWQWIDFLSRVPDAISFQRVSIFLNVQLIKRFRVFLSPFVAIVLEQTHA